jgi:hypothetical protein
MTQLLLVCRGQKRQPTFHKHDAQSGQAAIHAWHDMGQWLHIEGAESEEAVHFGVHQCWHAAAGPQRNVHDLSMFSTKLHRRWLVTRQKCKIPHAREGACRVCSQPRLCTTNQARQAAPAPDNRRRLAMPSALRAAPH